MIRKFKLRKLIEEALAEDVGLGDVTTGSVLNGDETGTARALAKQDMIVSGIEVFKEVFLFLDENISFTNELKDGDRALKGDTIIEISGSLESILTAERVALNFLQRMCGIATLTRKYVDEIEGTKTAILDTRKTTPCMREIEKYAVKTGGGRNHRFGLYGGVLIKDNHISAAGSISNAVKRVVGNVPPALKIEVEVKNKKEIEEALASGADIIMFDNMTTNEIKEGVLLVGGRAITEASGNVTLLNVSEIAETGVDFISIGAITHSVPSSDISLMIERT
jgi:nicotinate-nucleotide pyrophosphorylase (carboxylating)